MEEFSVYIKNANDQEIKALLLKLKNELKKENVTWQNIKVLLNEIKRKNPEVLFDIIPLILEP